MGVPGVFAAFAEFQWHTAETGDAKNHVRRFALLRGCVRAARTKILSDPLSHRRARPHERHGISSVLCSQIHRAQWDRGGISR